MKIVVITGSTRGIGKGLAKAFLERGCRIVISGRKEMVVEQVRAELARVYGEERVLGVVCDVTDYEQVEMMWQVAQQAYGRIDIWINNAGIAHPQVAFYDQPVEEMRAVVETNIIGAMNGARVALRGMREQNHGSLYNMEGLGSDGRRVEGLTLYGTTKSALNYLTDALVEETKETDIVVGALQPGMVITDMITLQYKDRQADFERAKKIFNVLADRVETVTPWLADNVLKNQRTGARIRWLTRPRLLMRFISAPFKRRDLFGG